MKGNSEAISTLVPSKTQGLHYRVQRSRVKSGCLELEWVGVGGTWLQLMCCAISCRCVPNFGRWGQIGDQRFGDDLVDKDRSQTKMTRREIQVVEQEEDLRDNAQRGLCQR